MTPSPNQERCCASDIVLTSNPAQYTCTKCQNRWFANEETPVCHTQNHSTTTATEGEMVYVEAPPFHEPAAALSQSPIHSTMEGWVKEYLTLTAGWKERKMPVPFYVQATIVFIRTLLAKERESAERRGREKAVDNIQSYFDGMFEDELWMEVNKQRVDERLEAARKDTDV